MNFFTTPWKYTSSIFCQNSLQIIISNVKYWWDNGTSVQVIFIRECSVSDTWVKQMARQVVALFLSFPIHLVSLSQNLFALSHLPKIYFFHFPKIYFLSFSKKSIISFFPKNLPQLIYQNLYIFYNQSLMQKSLSWTIFHSSLKKTAEYLLCQLRSTKTRAKSERSGQNFLNFVCLLWTFLCLLYFGT